MCVRRTSGVALCTHCTVLWDHRTFSFSFTRLEKAEVIERNLQVHFVKNQHQFGFLFVFSYYLLLAA